MMITYHFLSVHSVTVVLMLRLYRLLQVETMCGTWSEGKAETTPSLLARMLLLEVQCTYVYVKTLLAKLERER